MGITTEVHDGIAEVVMDNPPVNALTVAGWYEVARQVTEAGLRSDVSVVVLRAEGRGFNAGGAPYALAADASPRFSDKIVALNLMSVVHVSKAVNAVMQGQDDGGAIVNITSVSGIRPSPGTAAYGAAKAGVEHFTVSVAVEWAPKVRVNCVTVGLIVTEGGDEHYGGPEGMARVAATIPLGRRGTPSDVGDVVLFLASPLASYITGSKVLMHGGGERPAFLDAVEGK
jgi:NAD(P)-dependent dehydrogenase (short-subunit alcohol dehydrogenase family)